MEKPNSDEIDNLEDSPQVNSPFSNSRVSIQPPHPTLTAKGLALWVGIALGVAIIVGAVIFSKELFFSHLRTLREFPVQEYYENQTSLEGTRFRADLTIAGQIGWKETLGRLVNCTVGDGKLPVVVLVPPKFDSTSMEAGRQFQAELLVTEGGLIKVNFLKPN